LPLAQAFLFLNIRLRNKDIKLNLKKDFSLTQLIYYFRSTPPPLPEVFNKTDDDKKDNTQIAS
jgi:hypothetical protein